MREAFGVLPNGPNRFRYFRKGDLFGYRKSTWGKYWILFFFLRVISLPKMNHTRFSSDKMFFPIISQIFLNASLIIRIAQFLIRRKDRILDKFFVYRIF